MNILPKPFLNNDLHKRLGDFKIHQDNLIMNRRPVLINKNQKD